MKKNVPLGRIAYPSDPAKAIVFLCSKRAESITGQIIKVDGGRNLTSSGYVHYKGYFNMNCRFELDDENLWQKFNIFNYFKKNEKDVIKKVEDMNDKEENQSSSNLNINKKFDKIKETYEENYEENEEDQGNIQNNKENSEFAGKEDYSDLNSYLNFK